MSQAQTPVTTVGFGDQEVTTQANTTGEFSEVIDIQVPQGFRYEFPTGHPISMFIPTHESATVTTDSGTETVSLSNDLVNSPSVADILGSASGSGDQSNTATSGQSSLVVWDDESDIQTGVDSVDYGADSFDYTTPDATDRDLEVFYLWGDPAQVEFRTYRASLEGHEKQHIKTMREFHTADVFNENARVTFPESFTLTEKEHLKVYINTAVDLTNWDAAPGDGSSATPGDIETFGYADFAIPVRRVPMSR